MQGIQISRACCAGVIWFTYDVTGRCDISLLCGTMSGCVVVLCGECLTAQLRMLELQLLRPESERMRLKSRRGVGAAFVDPGLLLIYGAGAFKLIYEASAAHRTFQPPAAHRCAPPQARGPLGGSGYATPSPSPPSAPARFAPAPVPSASTFPHS